MCRKANASRHILALQKGFGPPTFRLGGGCSIQLSYWCIYWNIVAEKDADVNLRNFLFWRYVLTTFLATAPYTVTLAKKGGFSIMWRNGFCADLDDLIFDKDDGGPSER